MLEEPSKQIRVGVGELRRNLSHYLMQVGSGFSILVTSRNVVIAEIHPPAQHHRSPRRPGALRGKIEMAEDFDVLPADILDAMER